MDQPAILGLRTVIYHVSDLEKAKAWYSSVLGFGPYFNQHYSTPWGPAINYSGRGSDEVRRWAIDNALMWLRDFHVDGLRLDSVNNVGNYDFVGGFRDEARRIWRERWCQLVWWVASTKPSTGS